MLSQRTFITIIIAVSALVPMGAFAYTSKGSTLQIGEVLTAGEYLMSPNGQYRVVMQNDGNLVVYKETDPSPTGDKSVMWASAPSQGGHYIVKPGNYYAIMQHDVTFVVYQGSGPGNQGNFLWGSMQDGHHYGVGAGSYYAVMQNDRNFLLYRGTGPGDQTDLWNSVTSLSEEKRPSGGKPNHFVVRHADRPS